jgi:hypothetical protein
MQASAKRLVDLERKFWKSMVEEDTDTAVSLLSEPALMVSPHGSMKFDHAGYRNMAEHGTMVLKSFELSDVEVVFPNDETAVLSYRVKQTMSPRGKSEAQTQEMADTSTWVRNEGQWLCVMHTETPVTH